MSTLKRVLALSMALVMALSVGVFAADFTDADEISAACTESIDMLKALTVLDGFTDGSFRPTGHLTRGQVAKMMYVLLTGEDNADAFKGLGYFTDVTGHWAEGFINYCASNNILAGRGNGIFDPEAPVKGTELSKMLLVAAGYGLDKANYTGANWDSNVIMDARRFGLSTGYGLSMSEAAQRQWAAYLFGNLITKVEMAEYLFGEIVNGTKLGSENAPTFGESEMSLYVFEGVLTGTHGVELGGLDADLDETVLEVDEGTAALPSVHTRSVDFNAKASLLGQTVKVYSKVKDATKTGNSLYDAKNMTVLSVVTGGDTEVVETALGKISYDAADGYDIPGFKEQAVADAKIFGNDYSLLANPSTVLNGKGNDKVVVIDNDGDGKVDYIFVQQITYAKVTSVNTLRIVADGQTIKLEDINYVNGTAAKNDIVAITENYATGECVYDIRVLEPETTAKPTKWTGADTAITSVTISGTKYNTVTATLGEVDRTHTIFYFDGDYVVWSAKELDKEDTGLPTDLAIVTGITFYNANPESTPSFDPWTGKTTYSFKVKYMGLDGKTSSEKTYEYTHGDKAVGKLSDANKDTFGSNQVNTNFVYTAVKNLITPATARFVTVTENSDGTVSFDTAGTLVGDKDATYNKSKGILVADGKNYYVEDTTQVFFVNKDGKFSLTKGADLNGFELVDGYTLLSAITGSKGEALAIYLSNDADTALPGDNTRYYAAVTGSSWSKTVGLNGKSTYDTNSAIDANGDAFDLVTDGVKPARYTVFEYNTQTTHHQVFSINYDEFGSVSEVNDEDGYIVFKDLNGDLSRYYYDSKTVIFDTGKKHATVVEAPFESLDTAVTAAIVLDGDDIALLVINSDGNDVATLGLPGAAKITTNGTDAVTKVKEGDVLKANISGTPSDATVKYEYYVGSTKVATDANYTVVAADLGKTITLVVYDNAGNYNGTIEAEVEVVEATYEKTADLPAFSAGKEFIATTNATAGEHFGSAATLSVDTAKAALFFDVAESKITAEWFLDDVKLATTAGTGVAGTKFILVGNTVTIPSADYTTVAVFDATAATIAGTSTVTLKLTVDGTVYTANFTVGALI